MIRKRIAIFFVLFATTLLLVHAVVPHHHHKDHICLSAHYYHSNCSDHQHGLPVNDHSHDSQNDSEFCVLKQAVFIPSHQNQFDKNGPVNDKLLSFLDFQACVSDKEWNSAVHGIALSRYECTTPFIRCQFTISSSGLRAPPVA